MGEENVEITIRPDGKFEMHVNGVPGMACLTVTEGLVGLLGGEVEAQELTAEAYVEAEQDQEEQQRERLWG